MNPASVRNSGPRIEQVTATGSGWTVKTSASTELVSAAQVNGPYRPRTATARCGA